MYSSERSFVLCCLPCSFPVGHDVQMFAARRWQPDLTASSFIRSKKVEIDCLNHSVVVLATANKFVPNTRWA